MHNKIKLLRPDLILSKKLGMEKKSASAAHNCVFVGRHLEAAPQALDLPRLTVAVSCVKPPRRHVTAPDHRYSV